MLLVADGHKRTRNQVDFFDDEGMKLEWSWPQECVRRLLWTETFVIKTDFN